MKNERALPSFRRRRYITEPGVAQRTPGFVRPPVPPRGSARAVPSIHLPANPSAGATLGAQSIATLTIVDNTSVPTNSQPIDDTPTFVGQHYHDFLARSSDPGGEAFWEAQITQCGNDQNCIRAKRIGSFPLTVQYAGNSTYAPSTGTGTLTVTPSATEITVQPTGGQAGDQQLTLSGGGGDDAPPEQELPALWIGGVLIGADDVRARLEQEPRDGGHDPGPVGTRDQKT